MVSLRARLGLVVVGLGVAVSPVIADEVEPTTNAPAGEQAVVRGIQAPAGMLAARIALDISMSKARFGKPISIMPDIFYGVTDRLQVGLVHSGPMGWQTRPGAGLCLTGTDNGCPHVYDNVGADVMYGLLYGDQLHLSAHGSLYVTSIDAGWVMAAVGATAKLHLSDSAALSADPQLGIQLADRDLLDDQLYVPVELQYQLAAPTSVKLLTGVSGGLQHLGDTYQVPVGIGVVQNLTPAVDIGARVSIDNLLGKQATGAGRADERSAMLLVNLRH
ncbi:MAG: hypothetical protein R3B06_02815 [Kofleriaceae bacterium]